MKGKRIEFVFFVLTACLLSSCGKDTPAEKEPEDIWDKNRTTNIMVFSSLSGDNVLSDMNYASDIGKSINATSSSVVLIDRANVSFAQEPQTHPAAVIAANTKKVPVFVPIKYEENRYIGNTVLLNHSFMQMSLQIVAEHCCFLGIDTQATSVIPMKFGTVSFTESGQLDEGVKILQSALSNSMITVGIVRRSLLSELQSKISGTITSGHVFEVVRNTDQTSAYCIYLLASGKWKLRETSESTLSGNINCFQLQVEFLR